MSTDYNRCYRVLGVVPGCSWEELRRNYRHLVRRWHPDHRASTGKDDALSDRRIKEITGAYRVLSDYRRRHGVLPGARRQEATIADTNTARQQPKAPPGYVTDAWRGEAGLAPAPSTPMHLVFLASLGALAVVAYLVTSGQGASGAHDSSPVAASTAVAQPAPSASTLPYIGLGSSMTDVYRLHGRPSEEAGETWYYGDAKVQFANQRVIGWERHPSFPLRVDAYPNPNLPAQVTFTLGSTKHEVRAVQGLPLSEQSAVWDYGVVRVHFRDERVIGWHAPRRHPLP